MQWYFQVLKNYLVFSGRARRQEYWMFTLINIIISVAVSVIEVAIGLDAPILTGIYSLALLLPSLSVAVRRLHDTNRSGFWMFIVFIPIVGTIVLLVFMCMNGTSGSNRFGADPKMGEVR